MRENSIERFGIGKNLMLTLCAAVSITLPYIFISLSGILIGYPNIIPFCIAGLIGGIGFQIGYILYYAKKQNGNYKISKVLGLNNKLDWKQLAIYTPVLLVITILLFLGTQFIGTWMLESFFGWLPDWYILQADYSSYSAGIQVLTYTALISCVVVIIPVVEEVFFRGFLLPRMAWMGKWAVLANVVLFAAYHFWSPWQMLTRTIALLPLYYFVHKKQSLKLVILVHCLLNLTADVIFPLLSSVL